MQNRQKLTMTPVLIFVIIDKLLYLNTIFMLLHASTLAQLKPILDLNSIIGLYATFCPSTM